MLNKSCTHLGCVAEAKIIGLVVSETGAVAECALCKAHYSDLRLQLVFPELADLDLEAIGNEFDVCALRAVLFIYDPEQQVIVLQSQVDGPVFMVQTGYVEAGAIYNIVRKAYGQLRGTHELMVQIIHALGASPIESVVYGFDKTTGAFKCFLTLSVRGARVEIDCRVSDAVAISLSTHAPIKVNRAFLGANLAT